MRVRSGLVEGKGWLGVMEGVVSGVNEGAGRWSEVGVLGGEGMKGKYLMDVLVDWYYLFMTTKCMFLCVH